VLLLAGCAADSDGSGGEAPAGDEVEAFGDAAAAAAMDELYQGALEAGQSQVVVYGPPAHEDLIAAFEARFPGIDLVYEHLQGADRDTRLEAEATSGNHVADVAYDGSTGIIRLSDNGKCVPLDSVYDIGDTFLRQDGEMAVSSITLFGLVYNTDMLTEAELPTSWEDLLEPEWKGKISLVTPAAGGVSAFTFAQMLVPESANKQWGMDYLEALKAQDLNLVAKDALVTPAIATGETPLAINVAYTYFKEVKTQGGPVAFALLDEANEYTEGASCVLKDAPDELAAQLFVNWRFSPEGQKVLSETGSIPVMPGAPSVEGVPPIGDIPIMEILPDDQRVQGYAESVQKVIQLFT
jgi:iron(III) transport system substrate-binding protein